jgi:hypothetical protein
MSKIVISEAGVGRKLKERVERISSSVSGKAEQNEPIEAQRESIDIINIFKYFATIK